MAGRTRKRKVTELDVLRAAGKQYGVPLWIMKGVKVTETGPTGTGIGAVSSAGAKGPYQFIDSTAASEKVNVNDFVSSTFGAAKYLSELKEEHGTWDSALQAYSGGGYGAQTVRENSRHFQSGRELVSFGPQTLLPGGLGKSLLEELGIHIPSPEGLFKSGAEDVIGTDANFLGLGGVVTFFQSLSKLMFTPEGWLQVGEVTTGVIMIGWGLHQVIKSSTGVSPVRTATKAGTKAAEVAAVIK